MRVLSLLIFACLSRAQTPTIRVPVRLVTAPTLVFSSDDRLVFGLEERHFHLFDNGRNQKAALDTDYAPVSIAVAIQVNQDVRSYLRFIAKVGSAVEALLVGRDRRGCRRSLMATEVKVVETFRRRRGPVRTAAPGCRRGRHARAIDAGMRAVALLKERPQQRARVLIFIGQPRGRRQRVHVSLPCATRPSGRTSRIYVLTLPEAGKDFVSDTFSLQGLSSPADRGGFKVGRGHATGWFRSLARSSAAAARTDPFSVLTAATGGTQFHVRTNANSRTASP